MKVKIGDRFPWNDKGAVCLVTGVSRSKVKFDVLGLSFPMEGSMGLDFFRERFPRKIHTHKKKL